MTSYVALLIYFLLKHEYQIFSDLELNRSFDEHVSVSCITYTLFDANVHSLVRMYIFE
jgi:hypothetical protein